jgi:hypothetical protein
VEQNVHRALAFTLEDFGQRRSAGGEAIFDGQHCALDGFNGLDGYFLFLKREIRLGCARVFSMALKLANLGRAWRMIVLGGGSGAREIGGRRIRLRCVHSACTTKRIQRI